jgi:methyl-accepting chemotaxis protein
MPTKKMARRKSFSLSLRISFCLIVAAILPLIITLIISESQTRTTLITQASTVLAKDAETHAQLIDNYLTTEMQMSRSLDYTPLVQQYFADPTQPEIAQQVVQNGLAINRSDDPNQILVTFFNAQEKYLLSYSINGTKPQDHGKYLLPPEDLHNLLRSKSLQYISDVYYNPTTHQSTIETYNAIFSRPLNKFLGIVQHTLSLNSIWNVVNSEKGANGTGSYAFILDENGVRIVDPDSQTQFTAIAPLSKQVQSTIQNEDRYGTNSTVHVQPDSVLSNAQHKATSSFTDTPVNKSEQFQITRQPLSAVPWAYFISTPINSIVAVANQQSNIIFLIALFVLIPVAILGWIIGNRISTPILRSLESLVENSQALNQLSARENEAASEQVWIVGASETGIKSIQYYTHATQVAINQLNELGNGILQHPDQDKQTILHIVSQMMHVSQYFEKAVTYQHKSNTSLATAVKVINEVTAQLASGAKSASEAANELDRVVNQLRHIVGR